MVIESGSKSQLGSGVPAATLAKRSCSVVCAPSATLWQKPPPLSPRAALNVTGSHSSSATTWATREPGGPRVAPARSAQSASRDHPDSFFMLASFRWPAPKKHGPCQARGLLGGPRMLKRTHSLLLVLLAGCPPPSQAPDGR